MSYAKYKDLYEHLGAADSAFTLIKPALLGLATVLLLGACAGEVGMPDLLQLPVRITKTPAVIAELPSFPMQAAYKARAETGSVTNYEISGACSGTASVTSSVIKSATFEGEAALASTGKVTLFSSNCNVKNKEKISSNFLTRDFTPVGSSVVNGEFTKYLTLPTPYPLSVRAGDAGVCGTENVYTGHDRKTLKGQRVHSYVIEADGGSSTTAISNLISQTFDASHRLISTQQNRVRIGIEGTLTPVSMDIQYGTLNASHVVYTAN